MKWIILVIYHEAPVLFLKDFMYWKYDIASIILEILDSSQIWIPGWKWGYDSFILYVLKLYFLSSSNKRAGGYVDMY